MNNSKIKYIYLSNLEFDGTVFITQILDWLHLFESKGLKFDLYVAYSIKKSVNSRYLINQKAKIKSKTALFKKKLFLFPSRLGLQYLNVIIIFLTVISDIFKYKKTVIFSRAILGKEILILKKIFPKKIFFIYDARAASAEENFYNFKVDKEFTVKKFKTLAHVFQTEEMTLRAADKIFSVSKVLIDYFEKTYGVEKSKFFLYPCLGDSEKFYFSTKIRADFRAKLGYEETDIVLLYAGGINSKWHLSKFIFNFFKEVGLFDNKFKFLFLSADLESIGETLKEFPSLQNKCKFLKVPNDEVVNYLNAADYGTLFREDTIMNNVSSPTKFAEYILCGLPTIISENVGDYSSFLVENEIGVLLTKIQMDNIKLFDPTKLKNNKFDRFKISQLGFQKLSKKSRIDDIVKLISVND